MPEYINRLHLFQRNVCYYFLRILLIQTCNIEDDILYDSGSVDKSSTTFDSPLNIRSSSNYSVTHSEDCYLLYGSATGGAVGEFPLKALSSLTEYILEFDSYTTINNVNTGSAIGTNSRYAYIYLRSDQWHSWKTGNGSGSYPSESSFDINGTTNSVWVHYVITRNGQNLNLKAYVNGSELCNQSVTINSSVSNSYQGLAYAYGGNGNIKIKNLKIKPL